MRFRTAFLGALMVGAALVCGCAKYPGDAVVTRRLLDMRMTLRGVPDVNAYYLFVLDTNGRGADGPQVIAPLTPFLGNGRATGAYTYYVEYHQGRFELFRDQPEVQGVTPPPREALGEPFAFDDSSSSGSLRCTLDLTQLRPVSTDPSPTQVELNLITVNEIVLPGETPPVPRQSDGLGADGNTFLVLRMENGLQVNNNGTEGAGEVFGGRQLDAAYDIVDFSVAVRDGN
ncbi:MAG: hypothetical protein HZB16_00230 [Armatimonadetes bacterium]|nr:hypothetical protein [Armatimonadota bacterium]